MKNVVYCFSGTGNSLHVAKRIKECIENTEIHPMTTKLSESIPYDRIGFVFPVYFQGLPLVVDGFINNLNLVENRNTYFYAITTNGGMPGNGLAQVDSILQQKGCRLSYGKNVKMYSNYVVMYNTSEKIDKITQQSDDRIEYVINDIIHQQKKSVKKANPLLERYYKIRVSNIQFMDNDYHVNKHCIGCGLCAKVCPVKNIEMKGQNPRFNNQCEQCMACIQFCPYKALNYKSKTERRRRYHHPSIAQSEFIAFYKQQ